MLARMRLGWLALGLLLLGGCRQRVEWAGLACAPACGEGWVCMRGQCVPLCDPPCAAGAHCTASGCAAGGDPHAPPSAYAATSATTGATHAPIYGHGANEEEPSQEWRDPPPAFGDW